MSTQPYNEPAFPIKGLMADHQFPGMTLRDYFAARAMEAILGNLGVTLPLPSAAHTVASVAFKIADAMLAARLKEGE